MFPPFQQMPFNPQMFLQQFNSFAQNFQRNFGNVNPQQMVHNLLNSGQMTQAQFNQYRDIANKLTGQRL